MDHDSISLLLHLRLAAVVTIDRSLPSSRPPISPSPVPSRTRFNQASPSLSSEYFTDELADPGSNDAVLCRRADARGLDPPTKWSISLRPGDLNGFVSLGAEPGDFPPESGSWLRRNNRLPV